MSRLRVFAEDRPGAPVRTLLEHAEISRALGEVGVRFERWEARQALTPGAAPEEVIAAYRSDIDRLMHEHGYQSVDVISLSPDHPERAALRQKFLNEHT